jgi:hypothetical protein
MHPENEIAFLFNPANRRTFDLHSTTSFTRATPALLGISRVFPRADDQAAIAGNECPSGSPFLHSLACDPLWFGYLLRPFRGQRQCYIRHN